MENPVSKELLMFYNVENFFPADPKPVHKLDPTPSGLRNWDERKYRNKLFKVSHVFQLVKEKEGVLPMMCGLSEIQGKTVLEDLLRSEIFENKYSYIHYNSMDERGVDVALVFDKTKIEILHSEPITFFFEIDEKERINPQEEAYDTTRDILWCKVKFQGQVINVFVLHLPSKRENDINKPKRDYIIKELKEKVIELNIDQKEPIIICGDFNEDPDDENIEFLLHGESSNKLLNNPYQILFKNKVFSTFHQADGLLFDQIIMSNEFFQGNFVLNFSNAVVFNDENLSNWDKKFAGRPFRTFAGSRYIGGYSDHFPVFTIFENKIN